MPVQVEWDNPEKTIIRFVITPPFTWDDVVSGMKTEFALMNEVEHRVGVIYDGRHLRMLPPDALPRMRDIIRMTHPNEGTKVFVGSGALLKLFNTLIDILDRKYHDVTKDYRFVNSFAEAYVLLGGPAAPSARQDHP